MTGGLEWLEVRATTVGLLDVGPEKPGGEPAHEGVLSLVVGSHEGQKVRRLPTLFLGPSPLFVDRDVNRVLHRLEQTIGVLQRAYAEPIFLATPMKIGQRLGLYARDYNSRSAYRRRLERMGADLSPAPFVTLTPDGHFHADDMDPFRPDFVVSEGVDEPDTGVHRVSAGLLVSQVAMLRLGRMDPSELGRLVRGLSEAEGLGAARPAELLERLTR